MKYLGNVRLAESSCVILFIFKAEYSLTYIYIKIGAFYCQGIKRIDLPRSSYCFGIERIELIVLHGQFMLIVASI